MAWFTVYAPRLVHASPEGQPSKSVTETSDILPQGKVIHALSFWAYQTNNRDPIMLSPCAMMGHLYQFCLGFQRLQIRHVWARFTEMWGHLTTVRVPMYNEKWGCQWVTKTPIKFTQLFHSRVAVTKALSGTDLNHPHAYVQSQFHSGEKIAYKNPVMLLAAGIISTFYNPSCNVS